LRSPLHWRTSTYRTQTGRADGDGIFPGSLRGRGDLRRTPCFAGLSGRGAAVEVFLDNIVELLNEDLKRRGAPSLDAGVAYELQRANGVRLEATKTLDELGIEDGSTLVLAVAERGESFEPQYESLSTGLAQSESRFSPRSPRRSP
jgi:hypothetical protein